MFSNILVCIRVFYIEHSIQIVVLLLWFLLHVYRDMHRLSRCTLFVQIHMHCYPMFNNISVCFRVFTLTIPSRSLLCYWDLFILFLFFYTVCPRYRPWDTLAWCWDIKQASNQPLSRYFVSVFTYFPIYAAGKVHVHILFSGVRKIFRAFTRCW